MTLPSNLNERLFNAFVEDASGNVCLRALLSAGTLTGNLIITGNLTVQGDFTFGNASVDTFDINGQVTHTPTIIASGAIVPWTFTGAADTGLTTTVERPDYFWNGARTVTWATGGITAQRQYKFMAQTLAFAGASTVATAATVYIDRAIQAGANATITKALALWVDDGGVLFDSTLEVGGAITAPTTTNTINSLIINAGALSGVTTIGCAGTITNTAGDFTIYDDANNSDPYIALGTSATESLKILITCAATSKTLQQVEFITATADGTADYGKYIFDVDGTDILTIDDGGLELTGAIAATSGAAEALRLSTNADDYVTFTMDANGGLAIVSVDTAAAAANVSITADGTFAITSTGFNLSGAGAVSGVTTLAIGGALSGVTTLGMSGDLTMSGDTVNITHSGSTSLTITSTSGTVGVEGVVFTGDAISSVTTLNMTGAITAATATDTINGMIINAGAVSGVTTLAMGGALSGVTTIAADGGTSPAATLQSGNGSAAQDILILKNDDEGATGETGQTAALSFEMMGSIDSGSSHVAHEAARIEAYKISDWWHASDESDHDSGLKLYVTDAGTETLALTIANTQAATFVGTITAGGFTTTGTLDISGGTLTLADNQISGDKVEGGTIAAITITALTLDSTLIAATGAEINAACDASVVLTDWSGSTNVQGLGGGITTQHCQYAIVGKICHVWWTMAGTSDATTFSFTAPATCANVDPATYFGHAIGKDNGTALTTAIRAQISKNTSTINLYKDCAAADWTNANAKDSSGHIAYPIA